MPSPGLLTAIVIGTAQILAARGGPGTTVNARSPVPVASVSMSPATSTLQVGATQQLSAIVRDSNGNVLTGRTVKWMSTAQTVAGVSSDGLLTALTVGTTTINATSDGKSGSANITVTERPGAGLHEPADMTLITERSFSALHEAGWYDQRTPNLTLQHDASAPRSPAGIVQQRFAAGFVGGASAAVLETALGRKYTTIYVSYWIKYSSNWYGHPTSGVNKQMHLWINGGNHVFTLASGSGNAPLKAEIWLQGTAAGERNLYSNTGNPGTIIRGQWQRWEIVLKCNTNGAANGSIEWWIDGVKVGQYFDVRLEPTTSFWETIQWSPTWGGTGSTVPADQFESLDHIYISGRN